MSNKNQQLAIQSPSLQSMSDDQMASLPILSFLSKKRILKAKAQLSKENEQFEIEILNSKIIQDSFAVYEIKIKRGALYWIFQTRYSLLETLSSKLSKSLKSQLPKFPEKKLFGNLDQNFITSRSKQLDLYLKELLKLGGSENVVREFVRQTQKAATEINDPTAVKLFHLDA